MSAAVIAQTLQAAALLPAGRVGEIIDAEIERRRAALRMTESFYEFVKGAWSTVEPDPENAFVDGWHIKAICDHLQAVTEGQVRRLGISQPPGTAKSIIVAVMWNAWVWLHKPSWRLISGSHDGKLSIRDTLRTRDLVTSEWYQQTFRPSWGLKVDQNVKSLFHTTSGGFRQAFSLKGNITGHRGDCVLVDDPLDVHDRFSKLVRDKATDDIQKRLTSRLNDKRTNPMVLVGQRLHKEDPIGRVVKGPRWTSLVLAQRFDPKRRCVTSIGFRDPRTQPGELLFPARFPAEVVDEIEFDELGSSDFKAQHQQDPVDLEGEVWKRAWFHYWSALPLTPAQRESGKWIQLPGEFDEVIGSVDCSFGQRTKTETSSWTVLQVWGRKGAHRFLLDEVRERMSFTRMIEAIREQRKAWPQIRKTYIENKGSGSDVIDWSRESIPGLIAVDPRQDKAARAHAESGPIESGNAFLPDPNLYRWVLDWLDEICNFPGKPDDRIDAASQALKMMHERQFRIRIGRSKKRREAEDAARRPGKVAA